MRILLIMPDAAMHKLVIGSHVRSFREAPLTLATLAAFAPDPDIEYTLIDESVDVVPLDARPDLVGISVLTGTARRAYALADHFRARGVPVVLGGVHVTAMPDEARAFADCIVIGIAEHTWPRLLTDFRNNSMKSEYREEESNTDWAVGLPTPRWDLHRKSGYMMPYTVQFTRGCAHHCDFCMVPVIWKRFQKRPVADIIRDIKALPSDRFVVSDVSPFEDIEYAKELLTAMIPQKKTWGALATAQIADDPELFDLLVKAGCKFLLIGFESVEQQNLRNINKGFHRADKYPELVRMLQKAGIVVQGTFVFGFDNDDRDIFPKTVQFIHEVGISIPRYSIYTPYPGTRLFKRLEKEDRILSYDWGDYDTMHVVFQPAKMTPVELYEGFRWAYRETFKMRSIWKRTLSAGCNFHISFLGNLTYRIFVERLNRMKGFEMPVTWLAPGQDISSSTARALP